MSKMPVASASSHSKPNTASSAWTRLVHVTKTASQTPSRHPHAKVQARRQSSPTSASSMSGALRHPLKRQRVAGPQPSQSVPAPLPTRSPSPAVPRQDVSHELAMEQAFSTTSLRNIEVCTCLEGEPPLPNGKCSLSRLSKRRPNIVSSTSPTHANLRTFWGPKAKAGQSERDGRSQGNNLLEGGKLVAEVTATESVESVGTVDLVRVVSGQKAQDEIARQRPRRAVLDHEVSLLAQRGTTGINKNNSVDTTCKAPIETSRGTSEKAIPVGAIPTAQRARSWLRRRSKLDHETDELNGGDDYDGQAAAIAKEVCMSAGLEAEEPCALALPSEAPPARKPGLHESTQSILNRAPDPPQLATTTNSQHPISPNQQENAVARKPKRRLILHDIHPQQQKKRAMAQKQTVQTTLALAIGGNTGMRECKVCDTVYNPFHPEDVKVHAKRHAGVIRREKEPAKM